MSQRKDDHIAFQNHVYHTGEAMKRVFDLDVGDVLSKMKTMEETVKRLEKRIEAQDAMIAKSVRLAEEVRLSSLPRIIRVPC
jgi:hypothetical protein